MLTHLFAVSPKDQTIYQAFDGYLDGYGPGLGPYPSK